jgi:hypothetical protein
MKRHSGNVEKVCKRKSDITQRVCIKRKPIIFGFIIRLTFLLGKRVPEYHIRVFIKQVGGILKLIREG